MSAASPKKQVQRHLSARDGFAPARITKERAQQLVAIYERELAGAIVDRFGCKIATSTKSSSGYAQVKVADGCGTGHARTNTESSTNPLVPTYKLQGYATGVHAAAGEDHSHLCHRGHRGCMNPDHICIESHKKNLERKMCAKMVKIGEKKYYVQECKHHPKCKRPDGPVVDFFGHYDEM